MESGAEVLNISAHLCVSTHLLEVLKMIVRTTFSVSPELKKRLDSRPDVNWPEVFKEGLRKKLEKLEELRARGEL